MGKVAIIGSRNYPRLSRVRDFVRTLPPDTVVVSGGARGVDDAAELAAKAAGLRVEVFPVDTAELPTGSNGERRREYARRAYARNTRIIEAADEVVAFFAWCARPQCLREDAHVSHGTAHAIAEAKRLGKPLWMCGPDMERPLPWR